MYRYPFMNERQGLTSSPDSMQQLLRERQFSSFPSKRNGGRSRRRQAQKKADEATGAGVTQWRVHGSGTARGTNYTLHPILVQNKFDAELSDLSFAGIIETIKYLMVKNTHHHWSSRHHVDRFPGSRSGFPTHHSSPRLSTTSGKSFSSRHGRPTAISGGK